MHKTITIAKQKLTLECDEDESQLIDQVAQVLSTTIDEYTKQISHYDKAMLVAALELLVKQLKTQQQIKAENHQLQDLLNKYQHSNQSLSEQISTILNNS